MAAPLYAAERASTANSQAERTEAQMIKEVAEREYVRRAQDAARINTKDDATDEQKANARGEALAARTMLDSIAVPEVPRLVADDVTPEAAASAGRAGRTAGDHLRRGRDLRHHRRPLPPKAVPNMDLWLKGHSGDPLRVDRKGRPPEHIPRPALTLGLMIQPAVLDAIAANQQFRGRGFLARILYARPCRRWATARSRPRRSTRRSSWLRDRRSGPRRGMAGWPATPRC